MGAGVSAGENNDELVDNLMNANYLKPGRVEKAFRAVDRGAYFLPTPAADAYRDVAWKSGNLHISAPCIYSEVMENLKLEPGMSFLNLGSGTGYLNTIAGLLLGSYGINHGIELHADVIEYAHMKLEEFKRHSGAFDEYDFCEPKFMQGNCLCLSENYTLYDRVYCGAACSDTYVHKIKHLLKMDGFMVVPVEDRLVRISRLGEDMWTNRYLLSVSFTNLVEPVEGRENMVVPCFDIEPISLQELCRTTIRNVLRKIVEMENPDIVNINKKKDRSERRKQSKLRNRPNPDNSLTTLNTSDGVCLKIARRNCKHANRTSTTREEGESSNFLLDDEEEVAGDSSDSDDSSLVFSLCTVEEAIFSNCRHVPAHEPRRERQVIVHREDDGSEREEEQKTDYRANEEVFSEDNSSSGNSDTEQEGKRGKRGFSTKKRSGLKCRKIDGVRECDCEGSSSESECERSECKQLRMYQSPYSVYMKSKIQELPLPSNVKKFLNFYRDF